MRQCQHANTLKLLDVVAWQYPLDLGRVSLHDKGPGFVSFPAAELHDSERRTGHRLSRLSNRPDFWPLTLKQDISPRIGFRIGCALGIQGHHDSLTTSIQRNMEPNFASQPKWRSLSQLPRPVNKLPTRNQGT